MTKQQHPTTDTSPGDHPSGPFKAQTQTEGHVLMAGCAPLSAMGEIKMQIET
jgi:hypothetical protein